MPAAINGKMVVFCLMSSKGQSAAYSSKAKTKVNTKEVLKAKVLFFHTSEGLMVMWQCLTVFSNFFQHPHLIVSSAGMPEGRGESHWVRRFSAWWQAQANILIFQQQWGSVIKSKKKLLCCFFFLNGSSIKRTWPQIWPRTKLYHKHIPNYSSQCKRNEFMRKCYDF